MERHILIVDDEEHIISTLKRQLTFKGYHVHSALSGEEGLQILSEKNIPVVISDQRMPNMSGSEFLSHVKNLYPDTVRIILSGYADFNSLSDAINNGHIFKFITKPWDEKSLLQNIEHAFKRYNTYLEHAEAKRILNSAIESVVITDNNHLVQSINTAFSLSTNYDERSILGKKLNLIDKEFAGDSLFEQIFNRLEDEGIWQGETVMRKKSGDKFPAFLSMTAIKDHLGNIQKIMYTFMDISSQKENQKKIIQNKFHDSLTELPNREVLSKRLSSLIFEADQHRFPIAVIFIDLNRFQHINNVLGHHVGDLALKAVANRLRANSTQGELITRLGNDEFSIVVADTMGNIEITDYLDKLKSLFNKPFKIEEHEIHIMVSIGISIYPHDGNTAALLMQHANTALHYAKKLNIDQYQFYETSMNADNKDKMIMENDIQRAIKDDQFLFYYQPQLNIQTNQVESAEALIRWLHPQFGLIMPSEFMPLCEETALILDIEKSTLLKGCQFLKICHEKYNKKIRLSINLSAKEFSRQDIVDSITDILYMTNLESQYLEIEVTESVILENIKQYEVVLHQLHDLGIKLALDDFGTGYSSLSYLTHLPFDIVKIDQSFTRAMLKNKRAFTILTAIINLCENLGLTTVVEGIEQAEQIEKLKNYPCYLFQGHYISHPLDEESFFKYISEC